MASLQIEGGLEGLSETQVQFIRDVLEARGFQNNKVLFEPAAKAGENFVANAFRITVTVDGGDDFKIIAKVAPKLESFRKVMNTNYLFNNEIIMYQQVLPKYRSLQIVAGVPENERLKFADCYGCLSEEPNEVILLEDLKPFDYVMLNRLAPLNEEAILLVLKNFAILHSMSFVLKYLESETYKTFSSGLVNVWSQMIPTEDYKKYMATVENSALEVLDDEQYINRIRGVVSQVHKFAEKAKKNENPKHLVIQHGDAWTNNLMFRLNEEKPVDAIMIDYQQSCENNPVADIFYFVFNCTSYAARSKNYYEWINFYHKQLDKSLSNFGLRANSIYSKDQLDADLKRYSKMFFGIVVMLYGVLARTPAEAAEMHDAITNSDEAKLDGMQVESLSDKTVTMFKNKLQGLVNSYREFGYMD